MTSLFKERLFCPTLYYRFFFWFVKTFARPGTRPRTAFNCVRACLFTGTSLRRAFSTPLPGAGVRPWTSGYLGCKMVLDGTSFPHTFLTPLPGAGAKPRTSGSLRRLFCLPGLRVSVLCQASCRSRWGTWNFWLLCARSRVGGSTALCFVGCQIIWLEG